MSAMTDNANPETLIAFPPVPLLSGNTFRDATGATHRIDTVTVLLRDAQGNTLEVSLEDKFGGWWAPTN